jgi:hypothetical protein
MSKIRSDAKLYLTQTGAPAPVAKGITSITKALPSVETFATAVAGLKAGSIVVNTTPAEVLLNGKAFRVANPGGAGTTAELESFDGTKLGAAVGVIANGAIVYNTTEVAIAPPLGVDLLCACVATVTVAGQAPDSLNLDDMCTSTTVLGSPKPPTFQFTGWVDKDSPGFQNLIEASLESPKPAPPRNLLIDFGTAGGYIFGPVEIGEISITAGVNAGLAFSGSGVFTAMPTYSWAVVP